MIDETQMAISIASSVALPPVVVKSGVAKFPVICLISLLVSSLLTHGYYYFSHPQEMSSTYSIAILMYLFIDVIIILCSALIFGRLFRS